MTCQDTKWLCLPISPTPPPVIVPPALNGPIRGDTSGNAAQPGLVGEFIQRSVTGTLTIPTVSHLITTITPLSLGPGDWDISAKLVIGLIFNGASFVLNPTIPGMSSDMSSIIYLPGATQPQFTTATLVSMRNQLITASAATILQFDINVSNTSASSQTGPYTFTVNARRVR